MKLIIISGTKWVESQPRKKRADIIRMIYSLARDNHYEVVVAGQKWPK